MNTPNLPEDYARLLADVKERVRAAQYAALKAVNKELVGLYWDIGRMIAERQKVEGWGKSVVQRLAVDLQAEFRGVGGLSSSNLWRMKALFEAYEGSEKLAPLVREIGWSHNLVILERCKDPLEREFYIRMTRKFGWTKNVLIHQIENQSYEKSLLGQTNFDQALTPELRARAQLAVRDEYTFDFLALGDEHGERELEKALIARVEDFLRAMGGMFAFVGSQFRLEVGGKEYFIDLLLFHRRLRCLVAIELKVGEFQPEFVGKMQFYLTALDRQVREESEKPSIGIILCKEKNRTVVEYALHDTRKPMGVATYHISRQLPKELKDQLPSPQEIARLLEIKDL
ncbi:MAG: PDDEXK nuclease domain-containing protein [Gemmatimonadetes bacterium]|nr:PDDEXK nuclease domain-containing protein [Gemmatimonadota bacterium]